MNITFKINKTGQVITSPNLEKKLKRMKLTLEDITIIDNIEKPKKLCKEIRHLQNCFEAIYSNEFQCYWDNENEIPKNIGDYELIKIKPFKEWSIDYLE